MCRRCRTTATFRKYQNLTNAFERSLVESLGVTMKINLCKKSTNMPENITFSKEKSTNPMKQFQTFFSRDLKR